MSAVTTRARDTARRAAFLVATRVWDRPTLVLPAARRFGHGVVVDDRTDLVVEGFPRSGNSLAVAAIAAAQPEPIRVAHHLHAPAHVLEAVRRRKPVLLAIREPRAAADALVESKPFLTPGDAVAAWVRFHEPLVPVVDSIVVATFDAIHEELAGVVERVNERFGRTFAAPDAAALERAQPEIERSFRERTGPGVPLIGRTAGGERRRTAAPAASAERAARLFERLTRSR
jgi:hypothetical protein